jgi:hypothetical protein
MANGGENENGGVKSIAGSGKASAWRNQRQLTKMAKSKQRRQWQQRRTQNRK